MSGDQMRNPYAVLGVSRSATHDQVKAAFRKHAMACHPDRNPNDPHAIVRFNEIKTAYDIIGHESTRRSYDEGKIDGFGQIKRRSAFIAAFTATLSRTILNQKRQKPTRA
ncbi:MAG: J domain-containing protein [Pseudomonadota bacterium]